MKKKAIRPGQAAPAAPDRTPAAKPSAAKPPAARPTADEPGLSLDQLSSAFAEMLSSGQDPYPDSPDDAAEPAAESASPGFSDASAESSADPCPISPRTILEAIVFVGDRDQPLTSQRIAGLMRGVRPAEIDALVRELNHEYADRNCPYQIVAEGAGYQMRLVERFQKVRDQFYGRTRQTRLSQAAIEVLAVVAFDQPITADSVAQRRGKPSGAILSLLVRRQLLKLQRPESPGVRRRAVYSTTERFLSFFGLASLDDLPRGEDLSAP